MKARRFILILAAVMLASCATVKGNSKAETQDRGGFVQCVFDTGGRGAFMPCHCFCGRIGKGNAA